jgi:cytoskeletal protein RodZ
MSTAGKWIFAIIIIVAAGLALWKSGWLNLGSTPAPAPAQTQATSTPQAQAPQSDLPTASTDTSDAAITEDTAAIDVQMQGLTTDTSAVTASMNDKQITQ